MKKLLLFCVSIVSFCQLIAQNACPSVTASNDVSICTGQCATMTASVVATGLTTDYAVAPTVYNPYPYTGNPLFIGQDDIWSNAINLPFTFCFYGNNYNQVVIGANGLITFDLTQAGQYCDWALAGGMPGGANYSNIIACPYHDIDPSVGGDVYYASYGTYPCRVFVISWAFTPMYDCNNLIATQQVALFESTNIIETYIENKPLCDTWNGGAAIHGIENANGTQAVVVPGRNYPNQWTAVNDAWRFTPTGAPANYTLTWTDGNGVVVGNGPSVQVCPTATTIYTCTMDLQLCSGPPLSLTDLVQVDVQTPTVTASNTGPYCPGTMIQLSAGGGFGTGTLLWTNPGGNNIGNSPTINIPNAQANDAGTYTVVYTTTLGCTATATTDVVVFPSPIITLVTNTPASCLGGCVGALDVNVTDGLPPYTFTWNTGETTEDIASLCAGQYSLTVSDANGCTASANFQITGPPPIVPILTNTVNTSCNGACDGAVTVQGTGGANPYTYLWNNGQTGDTATGLCAGTYSVTATDANGCFGTLDNIIVTEPTPLVIVLTGVTNTLCNNSCDGAIDVTASGGTPPYSYLWSNGSTLEDATGLCAGSYDATVTDANGCTAVLLGTVVNQPVPVVLNIAGTTLTTCNGGCDGTATVDATDGVAPYQYLWSNGQTGTTATGLCAGTYSATATDANGCTASIANIQVQEPAAIVISVVSITNTLCANSCIGAIDIDVTNGTPGYSYLWSDGSTNQDPGNLCAGTYSVTVTDANGCTASLSGMTVNQPVAVVVSLVGTTNASCNGVCDGTATVTTTGGNGPYTYSWTNGQTDSLATALCAGTYGVTATDINGCFGTLSNINITEPTAILVSLAQTVNTLCAGSCDGSLGIDVSGGTPGYVFIWSNGSTDEDPVNLCAGAYDVTVTDANGCTAVLSGLTIAEPTAVSVTLSSTADALCNGDCNGSATIAANGGTGAYQYTWSNGQTGDTATGLCAGTYSATATDANGCTASIDNITINQPSPIVPTTAGTVNVLCNGQCTGSINLDVSGGAPGYTFTWSNGATSEDISNLCAGLYSVTVLDANGCSATLSNIQITEPTALTASIANTTNLSCNNVCNGSLEAAGNGGTAPYSYLWADGQTGSIATGLCAGTFNVTITDANGCTTTTSGSVTEPAALGANLVPSAVSCFGGNNGAVDATINGGTAPYTYAWSNGETTEDLANLVVGTYNLTATDANGCTITATANVQGPAQPLTVAVNTTAVACFGGNNGTATATPSGVQGTATYTWSAGVPNGAGDVVTGLTSGNVTVTVTDSQGCQATASANVTEPTLLEINFVAQINPCTGAQNGSMEVIAFGGTPGYTYTWNPGGATGPILANVGQGTYTVQATDANACTATFTLTLTDVAAINVLIVDATGPCVGVANGSLTASASGGNAPYSFNWGAQTGPTATGLASGNYTVTATDSNGCTGTGGGFLADTNRVTVQITAVDPCENVLNGSATADGVGGTGPYTYLWSDNQATPTLANAGAGAYDVTATDAEGCTGTGSVLLNNIPFPVLGITLDGATLDTFQLTVSSDYDIQANPTGAEANTQYLWNSNTPPVDINDPTLFQTIVNSSVSGIYDLEVTATIGACSSMDTVVLVFVNPEVRVPNAFTPDGNANNDLFYPVFNELAGNITIEEFKVFSRWGQIVHDNPINGWDGNYKESPLPRDVYIYTLKYRKGNQAESIMETGEVVLIR